MVLLGQVLTETLEKYQRLRSEPALTVGDGLLGLVHFAAAFEGTGEGYFVGIFEVAAHGEAKGDSSDAGEGFEQMAQVERGGFAFDAGADGHDDFAGALLADAADEGLDVELFGADAVHGGDEAAEDVVFAAIFAGFF